MSDTNSDYREAQRRKCKSRTLRNITVFAVLMLMLVGLFVIKLTRENSGADSKASVTETIEQ